MTSISQICRIASLLFMAGADPTTQPAPANAPASIEAIHVRTESDSGPGTTPDESSEYWADRKRGYCMENGDHREIYDQANKRKYVYDNQINSMTEQPANDRMLVLEFLNRGDADYNADVAAIRAARTCPSFKDETIQPNVLRRLSVTDKSGRIRSADIDPLRNGVLRTEAWTTAMPNFPSKHVVTRFDYPAPDTLDPARFARPQATGIQTIATPSGAQSRTQCAGNLRNLASLIMKYASLHDDKLPATLDDLREVDGFEPSMLACPVHGRDGATTYTYQAALSGIHEMKDLKMDAVLAECSNHPGYTIRAFGGGHVMVDSSEK